MITLETAKKLKAAGFPQDTELYYDSDGRVLNAANIKIDYEAISLPSLEELLAQLPKMVGISALIIEWKPQKKQWRISYSGGAQGIKPTSDVSLPETLASLWILLKQRDVIK